MSETGRDLDALRARLSEAAVACAPGEAGYAEAVNIWNADHATADDRDASDITLRDVFAALEFARDESLEVSVRGCGHNYSGSALTEGGLMIDLTPMKGVTVDAAARRATCGGGTTWGQLDAATQADGLAVTGGFVSRTGVAGLTLGGGIGWLVRPLELSCDNLVGARVVTADGRVLRASDTENPDLFWAIRGGGGNFGVVTEFEFAVHPVGPMVQLGLFLFHPDQGRDLFRFARDYIRDLPDDCGAFLAMLSAPPAPFVPTELHFTRAFGLVVARTRRRGEPCTGDRAIRQALTPMVDGDADPLRRSAADVRRVRAVGRVFLREGGLPDDLTDGAINVILEHQAKKMSPLSIVPIFVLGGAYRTADPDGNAFGGARSIGYVVNISATTPSPDTLPAERQWVREFWSALVEHAVGVGSYVNFMTDYEAERVRSAYGEKYVRLQQIKATYDPDNVFHVNVNIEPAKRRRIEFGPPAPGQVGPGPLCLAHCRRSAVGGEFRRPAVRVRLLRPRLVSHWRVRARSWVGRRRPGARTPVRGWNVEAFLPRYAGQRGVDGTVFQGVHGRAVGGPEVASAAIDPRIRHGRDRQPVGDHLLRTDLEAARPICCFRAEDRHARYGAHNTNGLW
jgi:FAD/FMN-containing dehydrogenase